MVHTSYQQPGFAEQAPGDEVAEYDIVMEVDTEELTENAYKVGKFAGNVTLLVEAQVLALSSLHPLKSVSD